MNKIRKITKLKNVNSYIQVKFFQGFKYIDTAGEILNLFEKDDGSISYKMSPEQLIIETPIEGINALKISNHDFWIHSENPPSLDFVEDFFLKNSDKILPITNVKTVRNIGWRNQFIFEKKLQDLSLNRFRKIKNVDLTGINFQKNKNELTINLNISLLEDNVKKTKSAVLFDLDTFMTSDISTEDIKEQIQRLKQEIKSTGTLDLINLMIEAL